MIWVDNIWIFMFLRTLTGIGASISQILALLVMSEQLPQNLRARMCVLYRLSLAFGYIINSIFGLLWHTKDINDRDFLIENFQYFWVFPAVFHVITSILHVTVYNLETPQFYLAQQRNTKNPDLAQKLDF